MCTMEVENEESIMTIIDCCCSFNTCTETFSQPADENDLEKVLKERSQRVSSRNQKQEEKEREKEEERERDEEGYPPTPPPPEGSTSECEEENEQEVAESL